MTKVVLMSDTHMKHKFQVPDGDLLLHSGDALSWGNPRELSEFVWWFAELPHPHKVLVAGNHDWPLQRRHEREESEATLRRYGIHYLRDSEVTLEGLRIYGSPWQPEFCGWAFNLPRGGWELKSWWAKIPEGLDFLITHGPPAGHRDETDHGHVGCELLLPAVQRAKPRFHLFGHIHSGYGRSRNDHTEFLNVSVCNEQYQPVNAPVVLEL